MTRALVEFDGVVKRFGDFTAVQELDPDIVKGEFLAIMGPSGCGKTTTLRMASPHFSPRGLREAAPCAINVVRSISYRTMGARPHDDTVYRREVDIS